MLQSLTATGAIYSFWYIKWETHWFISCQGTRGKTWMIIWNFFPRLLFKKQSSKNIKRQSNDFKIIQKMH